MKRKNKLKIKNIVILLLIIGTFIYLGVFALCDKESAFTTQKYSDNVVNQASKFDKDKIINNYNYSKTLEEMLLNLEYKDEYFMYYLEINYLEQENFLKDANTFLDKGYETSEVNNIFTLSIMNQEKLKSLEYTDFENYLDIPNYDANKTSRYDKYLEENEVSTQNAVTYVNINLDLEFYEVNEEISDKESLSVLVNKFNTLGDYVPSNLVALKNYSSIKMNKEAASYFEKMIDNAKADGFTFVPTTAYRDYGWQKVLYNNYVAKDGVNEANTYSAKPGNSEHQTGLAVDIKNPSYYASTNVRLNDEDYKWILENSYKYGFIVRYPKDSTHITGYIEEPWHLRYLGVDMATDVVKSGLTFDEYYDLYITKY